MSAHHASADEKAKRWLLREMLLSRSLFGAAVALGTRGQADAAASASGANPDLEPAGPWPRARHARKMLALDSCVQGTLAPSIDAATARVLDRIGISLVRVAAAGCCGALPYHLSGIERGLALARRNIDAWWPHVDRDIEAIVITASGCGAMVKEYGHCCATTRPTRNAHNGCRGSLATRSK
jgi:glycolate oxidase iron-sulfur subunit